MEEFEGLPGIEDYLFKIENKTPVKISEIEHIKDYIKAYTSLDDDQSKRILQLFFQQIRDNLLQGNDVRIYDIGDFKLKVYRSKNKSIVVDTYFTPKKSLLNQIDI